MFSRVSLDANGNERQRKTKARQNSLTGGTNASSHQAPLSLGVFARTLLEKANEVPDGKDNNDDELSPNSIRQLMFFHPRTNPKQPVFHESDSATVTPKGWNPAPSPFFQQENLFNEQKKTPYIHKDNFSNDQKKTPYILQQDNLFSDQKKASYVQQDNLLDDQKQTTPYIKKDNLLSNQQKIYFVPQDNLPSDEGDQKQTTAYIKKDNLFSDHKKAYVIPQDNLPSDESRKRDTSLKPSLNDSWDLATESVQGKNFLIIKTLGKGGSGEVFLVVEKENKGLFAMKKVHFAGINETIVRECVNEITMLQQLKDTDLVIRIDSWEINKVDKTMKIIMEYGHSDLNASLKSSRFSLQQVRATWESILQIVTLIHSRGIVHADLKPANFVWVGHRLKIIDFGIASRLQNDNTSILMLNPKGTINYISPETISPDEVTGKLKIGPKSDIWSLGCILYLLVYGKTPFHAYTSYASKVGAIVQGIIHYPSLPPDFEGSGVDSVLKSCFMRDPHQRPSAKDLLNHKFLASPPSSASRS